MTTTGKLHNPACPVSRESSADIVERVAKVIYAHIENYVLLSDPNLTTAEIIKIAREVIIEYLTAIAETGPTPLLCATLAETGYVVVPREPTAAMIRAGEVSRFMAICPSSNTWKAMIAAAQPEAPEGCAGPEKPSPSTSDQSHLQIRKPPSGDITIPGLVTIKRDGTLIYHDGYTPDKAARAFWDAIGRERTRYTEGLAAAKLNSEVE